MLVLLLLAVSRQGIAHASGRPLTIDDVLDITRLDRFSVDPAGEWAVAVLQRPAHRGEVYGRTAYEVDPSRSDIWLISLRSGEHRNITQGADDAAGYWCATWSPDGTKLAMLSTQPEGGEPRGGDNVRIYVWEAATGTITRVSDAAVMTQTRYGSPLYRLDLRGGANPSVSTHRCSDEENAPFLWLDDRRLLAVMLPAGGISGLVDEYSRPTRLTQQTLRALREGIEPTFSVAGSGGERMPEAQRTMTAELRIFDTESRAATDVASLPIYPFNGEFTISIAPDGREAAILVTVGTIPPVANERPPSLDAAWLAERRPGFVRLEADRPIRWVEMPAEARYPLELFSWSPDSRRIALRARDRFGAVATPLFVVSSDRLSVEQIGAFPMSVGGLIAGSSYLRESPIFWVGNETLLARGDAAAPDEPTVDHGRPEWWLLRIGGEAINLTRSRSDFPAALRQAGPGQVFAIHNGNILILSTDEHGLQSRETALHGTSASIVWPVDPRESISEIVVAVDEGDRPQSHLIVSLEGAIDQRRVMLPANVELLSVDPRRNVAITRNTSLAGVEVALTSLLDGSQRSLLSHNTHLAQVDWGERRLIEYRSGTGQAAQAAVILPPGFRADRRYPVIAWICPGYVVRSLNSYFLDPNMPGFYNLYLYAAEGYVVLIPSLPRAPTGDNGLPDFSADTLAAVDRLVEMGIADRDRVGVMAQSFGGFGVYALVTQTNRFRAAVAMAGITDFNGFYSQFDAAARGYEGIEHEKSGNWLLSEIGQIGMGVPPHAAGDRYWRNSPISYADRVETPLLLIHGELDKGAPMSQAESFFFSLYRQGKTARLLRYWGESHALALSPANVRSVHREILDWFDRYLRSREAPAPD